MVYRECVCVIVQSHSVRVCVCVCVCACVRACDYASVCACASEVYGGLCVDCSTAQESMKCK